MSGELKNIKNPGNKEDIIYFLKNIIGDKALLINDLRVLCSRASGGRRISCDSLISYCLGFGWISVGSRVQVDESLFRCMESSQTFNCELISRTVHRLFKESIFKADMFSYDIGACKVAFRNEQLSLTYSSIRNALISQGFFIVDRNIHNTLYVNPAFEKMVSGLCKENARKFTLEQLQAKLESDSIAGVKAEEFVLAYEKRRITNPSLTEMIRIISEVDVCAGYDVISFESNQSSQYDRYIEVKAVSGQIGFYWSYNEYETAKLKGANYYLYLVELSKIGKDGYIPLIINNPATIMQSDEWLVEPETYHIRRI